MIRKANVSDINELSDDFSTQVEMMNTINDDSSSVFVYDSDNEIKGYIISQIFSHGQEKICCIEQLYVAKEARNNHIGSEMISFVREFASDMGCETFMIGIWVNEIAAEKICSSFGFSSDILKINL